jgi:hypothetical protein
MVDMNVTESKFSLAGTIIGPQGDSPWLNMVPWGFYKTLRWSHDRYAYAAGKTEHGLPIKPFTIYVTENGCDVKDENKMNLAEALDDQFR